MIGLHNRNKLATLTEVAKVDIYLYYHRINGISSTEWYYSTSEKVEILYTKSLVVVEKHYCPDDNLSS